MYEFIMYINDTQLKRSREVKKKYSDAIWPLWEFSATEPRQNHTTVLVIGSQFR